MLDHISYGSLPTVMSHLHTYILTYPAIREGNSIHRFPPTVLSIYNIYAIMVGAQAAVFGFIFLTTARGESLVEMMCCFVYSYFNQPCQM